MVSREVLRWKYRQTRTQTRNRGNESFPLSQTKSLQHKRKPSGKRFALLDSFFFRPNFHRIDKQVSCFVVFNFWMNFFRDWTAPTYKRTLGFAMEIWIVAQNQNSQTLWRFSLLNFRLFPRHLIRCLFNVKSFNYPPKRASKMTQTLETVTKEKTRSSLAFTLLQWSWFNLELDVLAGLESNLSLSDVQHKIYVFRFVFIFSANYEPQQFIKTDWGWLSHLCSKPCTQWCQ